MLIIMAFNFKSSSWHSYFLAIVFSIALVSVSNHDANAAEHTVLEQANKKLVKDFLASMTTLNTDNMIKYLSDDFVHQGMMSKTEGKHNYVEYWGNMMKDITSYNIDVLRSTAIGDTVLVERLGVAFEGSDKGTFHQVSFFLIKDGKIKKFQSYRMPK